ncbi:MAG: RpiB/LacA/LacB family sugar-phosphate isomerase [bacterium]|nr:RpiB/LacA/LacB family sugar-phosphate isomerase [bacterium]
MKPSIIYLGADHAGFELKEKIENWLLNNGYCVEDLSPTLTKGDDYPKIGFHLAKIVSKEPTSRGILICGSGVGVTIAANRVNGARAFTAHSVPEATRAREHNNANIISLSGWNMSAKKATTLLQIFFNTPFSKVSRHARRVKQLH